MKQFFLSFSLLIFPLFAQAEKLNCVITDNQIYLRLRLDSKTGVMTHNDWPAIDMLWEYKKMRLVHVGGKNYEIRNRKGVVYASLNLGWGGFDFSETPRKTSYPYFIQLHQIAPNVVGGCGSDLHKTYKTP